MEEFCSSAPPPPPLPEVAWDIGKMRARRAGGHPVVARCAGQAKRGHCPDRTWRAEPAQARSGSLAGSFAAVLAASSVAWLAAWSAAWWFRWLPRWMVTYAIVALFLGPCANHLTKHVYIAQSMAMQRLSPD